MKYFRLYNTSFLEHLPSLVCNRDASGRALCGIHDDYTALRRRAKLLNDVVAICRDVARAVGLQHDPLDGWLKKHFDQVRRDTGK